MLILIREQDQRIMIGDGIILEVVEIVRWPGHKPRVRLGVTADRSVPIMRQELLEPREAKK